MRYTVKKLISDAVKKTQKKGQPSMSVVTDDGVHATVRTDFGTEGIAYTTVANVTPKPAAKTRWLARLP